MKKFLNLMKHLMIQTMLKKSLYYFHLSLKINYQTCKDILQLKLILDHIIVLISHNMRINKIRRLKKNEFIF